MRLVYKIKMIKLTALMPVIAVLFAMNGNAVVRNCQTIVDDVRYMTEYYHNLTTEGVSDIDWYMQNTLEFETKYNIQAIARRCHAEVKTKGLLSYDDSRVSNLEFLFYDGTRIPSVEYAAILWKSDENMYSGLPNYEADKDEDAKRSPYYTGDVWLQDSVCMPALPDLNKTTYHIVCDMLPNWIYREKYPEMSKRFNEKLTSIRTPRYAVVRRGLFKDCTGLRTARIGAAQSVEAKAFENCTRLETVFFESAPYVMTDAFYNCPNIKYVVMNTKLPQAPEGTTNYSNTRWYNYEDDRDPFDEQVYSQATLYVREDQMEAFRNDLTWGKFKNIRDIEEYLTGIETVNPDSQVGYEVYDLSGVKVRSAVSGENWREGLPAGLYIVKSTLGTVKKEYIR